jgi:peptidyl-tRNA hydrolase, PTH2 family
METPKLEQDPITCYLIIREDLAMSAGKAAAQVAHAMQYLLVKYYEWKYPDTYDMHFVVGLDKETSNIIELFDEWMKGNHRKVVLKANEKEWMQLKECPHVLVVDAGLTEIPEGSETCIGLYPMPKSQAPKVVKRLQVLK